MMNQDLVKYKLRMAWKYVTSACRDYYENVNNYFLQSYQRYMYPELHEIFLILDRQSINALLEPDAQVFMPGDEAEFIEECGKIIEK